MTEARVCERCGESIARAGTGRPPRYCSRSCRQRAYELRRARRELLGLLDVAPDPEAADLLDQALANRQGERTDLVPNVNEVKRPTGNARATALRKLRKDKPELHADVEDGQAAVLPAAVPSIDSDETRPAAPRPAPVRRRTGLGGL